MKRGFALLSRLGHLERGLDIWFKVREGKEDRGRERKRKGGKEGGKERRGERNVEELRDT